MSDFKVGIVIGLLLAVAMYMSHCLARAFAVDGIARECKRYGEVTMSYQRFECKAIEIK